MANAVSKEKKEQLTERRRLVAELREIGLSYQRTASMLKLTGMQVRNDVVKENLPLGRMEKTPDEILRALLTLWASLRVVGRNDKELERAVCRHPSIRELNHHLRGLVSYHLSLKNVRIDLPNGYGELLSELFGSHYRFSHDGPSTKEIGQAVHKFFTIFLKEVHEGCVPQTLADARGRLLEVVLMDLSLEQVVIWADPALIVERVDQALATLKPQEMHIMQKRFGIGCSAITLSDVGKELSFTSERIRQIETRALRRLRVGKRADPILACLETTESIRKQRDDLVKAQENSARELELLHQSSSEVAEELLQRKLGQETSRWNPNLDRRVDEFEMSVRWHHGMQDANLVFIGELVQRSKKEMLRIRSFGPKTFEETKKLLTELGLSLGMTLDGWKPPTK